MNTLWTKKTVGEFTGLHPETCMRLAREQRFPQPIKLGPTDRHPVRFIAEEVMSWVEARMAERGQGANVEGATR